MKISVDFANPIGTIAPELHGHFMEHLGGCIYEGIWKEGIRSDVVHTLQAIAPPVIRWPGGCFADDYDWRDGIGPTESRPVRVVSRWGGDEIETNAFGTHEFLALCRAVGAEAWFGGNVATGTPGFLREWIEYCNYPAITTRAKERAANGHPEPMNIRYWGIGNESWDCGGKFSGQDYARAFKRWESAVPRYLAAIRPFLIACGPDGNKPHETEKWTREFCETFFHEWRHGRLDGYDAHFYTWNSRAEAGTATEFSTEDWRNLLSESAKIEALIVQQRAILDEFDPERKIGLILGEWGTWHPPTLGKPLLWQQNTLRDAVSAAMTLDIFHRYADTLIMANLAQTINVLQSPLLVEGDHVICTPTYHVFAMYRAHRSGISLPVELPMPLVGSASLHEGHLILSVVNTSPEETVEAILPTHRGGTMTVLTHHELNAHNTVENPEYITPTQTALAVGEQIHGFVPASVSVFTLQQ